MVDWIRPEWPAPPAVRALITTRAGGVSRGPFASMNLGAISEDEHFAENRARLRSELPAEPTWLNQVHGARVIEAAPGLAAPAADAVFTHSAEVVCAVLTADCLPVLMCDDKGLMVAAVHCGWRGLAAGILERAVAAVAADPRELMVYFGPAVGPQAFEVGEDVRQALIKDEAECSTAFSPHGGRWLADLYLIARIRLASMGVSRIYGGGLCTFSDPARFFSHRRDKVTGRMASLIWLENQDSKLASV